MQQKRKQTLRAGAGLLTALTVSVGLLAGCNPASFLPGQSGNPAAPGTPSAAPLTFATLSGQATIDGVPLKNATITVVDALNSEAASIISAGGGNIISAGGGNLTVKDAGLKTDAQGNFSIEIASADENALAEIVVSADGKNLSTLVSGDGELGGDAAKYSVAFHTPIPPLVISPITTIRTNFLRPIIRTSTILRNPLPVIRESLPSINPIIDQVFLTRPNLSDLLGGPPPSRNGSMIDTSTSFNATALNNIILGNTELRNLVNQATQNVVTRIATVAQDPANRRTTQDTQNLAGTNFIGTDITITVDGNKVQVGDMVIDATPPSPSPSTAPSSEPSTAPSEAPTTEASEDPGVNDSDTVETAAATEGVTLSNSAKFSPTVTVGTSSVSFSQPNGNEDISSIFVKYKKADATAANASAPGLTGTVGGTPFWTGTKAITFSGIAAASTQLSSRFGFLNLTATENKYAANMVVNGVNVATFRIYETTDAYYLVTKYILNNSVTTNSGHQTTVNSSAFTLKLGSLAETVITSRVGNTVEGYYKVK